MKYVVVYWTETNETSVMEDNSVRDETMLSNDLSQRDRQETS